MNFSHPLLEKAITLKEGEVVTLVMENPVALRNTVYGFKNENSTLVLSEDYIPVEMVKHVELIDNVFEVDFASKKIATKLNHETELVVSEYPQETISLIDTLNRYAELLADTLDYPVQFSMVENMEKVIKLLEFSIDSEEMSIPERILTYMGICRRFFAKKIFVLLNFKGVISDEEFELFCRNIEYEKFCVLILESYDHNRGAEQEKKIIIDHDLCVVRQDKS